jgi:hypothetical protein
MTLLQNTEVTAEEIARLLGEVDAETLLAIIALHPTPADLEEAALRIAGNGEALGGKPATGLVAAILDLLETDQEDQRDLP